MSSSTDAEIYAELGEALTDDEHFIEQTRVLPLVHRATHVRSSSSSPARESKRCSSRALSSSIGPVPRKSSNT
jgi:hypothetical protein